MKAPSAVTLKESKNSEKRIGPENKRSQASESSIHIEDVFLKLAPLPCSFDISPIQKYYFTEFSYHDVFGGIMGGAMNEEITARIVEHSIENITPDYGEIEGLKKQLSDKYVLSSNLSEPDATKIIFFPGSNLLHVVSNDYIDRILYEDENIRIKPHPIMTPEGLKMLGRRYGYWRLIPPSESGIHYLLRCKQAWSAMNSEIGLICGALKIPHADISRIEYMQKLTYASTLRLFKNNDVEHNYQTMARVLTSKNSGYLMPWHDDIENRARNFFGLAMKIREYFRPRWPYLGEPKGIREK